MIYKQAIMYYVWYGAILQGVKVGYLVNVHNYCLDDIDMNMKWYILYIVYSTHL